MNLRIGVRLAPRVDQIGEFLADARALDAAGAAALWVDGDEDPWLLLAAAAVVTSRVKLVAPCSAAEAEAPDRLARRVADKCEQRVRLDVSPPGLQFRSFVMLGNRIVVGKHALFRW